MSATIKYKGTTLASITTNTSKTLKTSGKYCEGDIVVENVQDGGITPTGNKAITATTSTQTGIDVTNYATVSVAPTPSETKSVTTNGDVTPTSGKLLSKVTVNVPTGTARTSSDLTASGATVTVPAGLYASDASKSVASGTAGTPSASKSDVVSNTITVTPSVTNTTGYITGGTKTGTSVSVSASEVTSGNKSITATTSTQTDVDVTNYKTVSVAPTPSETKSTTVNGDVTPSSGKLLSKVTVNVPTGTARSASDLTVSGATVTVPAGLYSTQATKSVASGSAGTPSASKGTVSNNSVTVTPSVTNTTGYITGGTKTGTGVTVSASELVSGNKALTPSTTAQTNINVKNYATASVAAITKELLASLDADFVAENIKKDVDLFGLLGTLESGGGGSSGGNGASGTYIVASTETIGTSQTKAILIDTGLPQVNYFAFSLDGITSTGSNEYKILCGVWFRQNDGFYGRRYHQSGSSYTSIYPANNTTGNNSFVDINGTMQIRGVASTSKIVAGDRYYWFAL